MPQPPAKSRLRTWIERLAPYVITAVVVVAILRRYPIGGIAASMARGHVVPMIALALALACTLLPLVSAWDSVVLRSCFPAIAYLDVLRGKAGTSVLLVLGYAFGSGGYGVWIARTTGCGARLATGAVLYVIASDLCAVSTVAIAPVWLVGFDAAAALRIAAPLVATLVVLVVLVGGRVGSHDVTGPGRIFDPWRLVPPSRGLLQIAGRCFNIALIVAATWAGARVFGLDVPFGAMAIYMPVILLVGSLPVNVGVLGPVQAVWLLAFRPWAPGEQILAFQLLWQLSFGVGIVLRGLPFVRRVVAEIGDPPGQPRTALETRQGLET